MSKKYDTGERLCSQRNIFIPQENVNIGGWKTFPFHLVKTSICLSLSARLFITIKFFFSKIFSLISILVYFCMRVSKEFKTISSEKYNLLRNSEDCSVITKKTMQTYVRTKWKRIENIFEWIKDNNALNWTMNFVLCPASACIYENSCISVLKNSFFPL